MTLLMKEDQTVKAFSLRASRVAIPPVLEQSLSGSAGSLANSTEHVDGDLAQARALSDKHPDAPTALARLAASEGTVRISVYPVVVVFIGCRRRSGRRSGR